MLTYPTTAPPTVVARATAKGTSHPCRTATLATTDARVITRCETFASGDRGRLAPAGDGPPRRRHDDPGDAAGHRRHHDSQHPSAHTHGVHDLRSECSGQTEHPGDVHHRE